MSDIKIVQNTSVILDDLMAGDMSTLSREQLKNFDFNKIQLALDYLVNNENLSEAKKLHYIGNSWKIFYKRKPPTPEEFMTEEWIGPLAEHTYPRVKQTFLDFMNPTTPYRNLILYPHMGWGKTYAAMFMSLYCDTHIALMRNAKRYLGLNPASPIARAFLSFSIEKVQETLLEPFLLALENSPMYEKVHTRDGMAKREAEQAHNNQIDKIFWTTASPSSHIHISNGTQIKIVSSLHRLLGLNLVGGAVTELSHFREAGMTDDYIMDTFWELRNRVQVRTMKGNYWGRVILDSSPDDISGAVDQYINGNAKEDHTNMIVRGSMWEWSPENHDMNNLFPIYRGGAGRPPQILEDSEINNFDVSQVLWVPGDLKNSFKNNPVKSLRDLAGLPSGSQARLFMNYESIDSCFSTKLKNLYTYITASTKDDPKDLIWNKVHSQFFKNDGLKVSFYYKPHLPRAIHIDSSTTGDITGIAATHVEKNADTGEIMFITDFSIAIAPDGGRISLDAVKFFIEDLRNKGHMNIAQVSYDTFQSEASVQYLESRGFNIAKLSVDRSTEPYYHLYSMVESGRFKMGRNIFFKNNLKSLEIVKRNKTGSPKVDHTNGPIPDPHGDSAWETSIIGMNAKDVSDAVCGSVYAANMILAPLGAPEIWNESHEGILSKDLAKQNLQDFMDKMGIGIAM